jgi:hypothetical protein
LRAAPLQASKQVNVIAPDRCAVEVASVRANGPSGGGEARDGHGPVETYNRPASLACLPTRAGFRAGGSLTARPGPLSGPGLDYYHKCLTRRREHSSASRNGQQPESAARTQPPVSSLPWRQDTAAVISARWQQQAVLRRPDPQPRRMVWPRQTSISVLLLTSGDTTLTLS